MSLSWDSAVFLIFLSFYGFIVTAVQLNDTDLQRFSDEKHV